MKQNRINSALFAFSLASFFVFSCSNEPGEPGDPVDNTEFSAGVPIALISMDAYGNAGNTGSDSAAISFDGRYIAFTSGASNFFLGDTIGSDDVFVVDRLTGAIECVSRSSSGLKGNGTSGNPSISADGRYVAFQSIASNLVTVDANAFEDVFVYDTLNDTLQCVSLASNGSQGNGASSNPAISADGRYVVFQSNAANFVAGDDNSSEDVFVHDRQTGTTECVSIESDGTPGNGSSRNAAIDGIGRIIAFQSSASNLVANDTNSFDDVFVYDRQTAATERISLASSGSQGNDLSRNPSISADGRFVAFDSLADNFIGIDTNGGYDIFCYDRTADTVEIISLTSTGAIANGLNYAPSIDASGRYVAYHADTNNLIPNDGNFSADVFVFNRDTDTLRLASTLQNGAQGNDHSFWAAISGDGQYVTFESEATNLTSDDTDGYRQIFAAPAH